MINEEIKEHTLYLSIQDKVQAYYKVNLPSEKVKYITLDMNEGMGALCCTWKELPSTDLKQEIWLHDDCNEAGNSVETLTQEEKEFTTSHWNKLIWQIK